jgi:hypothetical protein
MPYVSKRRSDRESLNFGYHAEMQRLANRAQLRRFCRYRTDL